MLKEIEPRFVITLLLIGLFGYAYLQDPADQAMKGAIIAAFSAAYGFWIGSKQNEQATENTGKAFDAIQAAAAATPVTEHPQPVVVANTEDDPAIVKETTPHAPTDEEDAPWNKLK